MTTIWDTAAPSVPAAVAWQLRPGSELAHAFSEGPGWMRSVCRDERWTAALRHAGDDVARCADCVGLLEVESRVAPESEAEKREAWGK